MNFNPLDLVYDIIAELDLAQRRSMLPYVWHSPNHPWVEVGRVTDAAKRAHRCPAKIIFEAIDSFEALRIMEWDKACIKVRFTRRTEIFRKE